MKHSKAISISPVIFSVCVLASCAPVPKINTPSGRPQVTINRSSGAIKNKISSHFLRHGANLVSETSRTLRFSEAVSTEDELIFRVGLGNSYSSQPRRQTTFHFIPESKNRTLVTANISMSMQGAFGQNQGMDLSTGRAGSDIQGYLVRIKQKMER